MMMKAGGNMKTIDIHNLHYEMEADKVILSKDDFDELLESYTDIRSKLQEYQQLYNKVKKALDGFDIRIT